MRHIAIVCWILLVGLIMGMPVSLFSEERNSIFMHGVMTGPDPLGGRDHVVSDTKIFFQQDSVRIEFDYAGASIGIIFNPASSMDSWIINEQAGVAVPIPYAPILSAWTVDPRQPCLDMGMGAHCEMTQPRLIAGVLAQGWRYRRARNRGPGGTDAGELWVDPGTGLVLTYHGQTTRRRDWRRFQAVSVSFQESLPDTMFELPEALKSLQMPESGEDSSAVSQ